MLFRSKVRALRSEAALAAFAAIQQPLLAAFAQSPEPERALLRWEHLLANLPSAVGLVMISTEEGAATTLYCAGAPALDGQSGLYYDRCRPKHPSRVAQDVALAGELWRCSQEWVR